MQMNHPRNKLITVEQALDRYVRSGMTLMIGGFGRGGAPFTLLEHLSDCPDKFTDLTLIKNDGSEPDLGVGPLFQKGIASALVSTHIGLNPDLIARMNRGEVSVILHPQGIFAEKIRAAGAGIPAFLTDIGIDTPIAEGKERMAFNGKTYLIEPALHGDVALIAADRVDPLGNCYFRGSNRNMNVVMGSACKTVLVEALTLVDVGAIAPEAVHLPGIFVTAIVQAEPRRHVQTEGEGR